MVDTTNPAPGVDSGSDEAAMASLMSRFQDTPEDKQPQESAPPETAQPPVDPAPNDELTADDLPEVDGGVPSSEQSAVEAFEIVHNGQQRKLSREETIKYAQQGFDYTQKTQQLAEGQRHLVAALQRAQEIEQMAPAIATELAQVKSLESQLAEWDKVDFVALATNNPEEYPRYQAQYDALRRTHAKALNTLQAKHQEYSQKKQQLTASQLQQERQRLGELVPEFRDATKFEKAAGDVRNYLIGLGAAPQAIDGLSDAISVSVAYKAMRYDQLLKAKTEKVKQLRTAPPVTRPGASATTGQAQADRTRDAEGKFKKSGELKDAAALLLNRWRS
jgi:uncharacterized phage infection (PIP) family protein YhgE